MISVILVKEEQTTARLVKVRIEMMTHQTVPVLMGILALEKERIVLKNVLKTALNVQVI